MTRSDGILAYPLGQRTVTVSPYNEEWVEEDLAYFLKHPAIYRVRPADLRLEVGTSRSYQAPKGCSGCAIARSAVSDVHEIVWLWLRGELPKEDDDVAGSSLFDLGKTAIELGKPILVEDFEYLKDKRLEEFLRFINPVDFPAYPYETYEDWLLRETGDGLLYHELLCDLELGRGTGWC